VYYKIEDMLKPQMLYQIDVKKGEVACMASLVPTFEPVEPQDAVITSETPESLDLSEGRDFCFVFMVDRSGSMKGLRMETTKTALKLFI
jgi:Mg-chelatase subunit ChlD